MKKTYGIEVDCAACANKMEAAVGKLPGVETVAISFLTQKITVAFTEDADIQAVMQRIQKTCRKVDPDCTIIL